MQSTGLCQKGRVSSIFIERLQAPLHEGDVQCSLVNLGNRSPTPHLYFPPTLHKALLCTASSCLQIWPWKLMLVLGPYPCSQGLVSSSAPPILPCSPKAWL